MKRLLLKTILSFAIISLSWGTRYMHNTGVIQLRVDDVYQGGFVELNYVDFSEDENADVMWLSFIALWFDGWDVTLHGRAADEGPLFDSDFLTLDSLTIDEEWEFLYDTLYDTIIDSSETTFAVDSVIVDSVLYSISDLSFYHNAFLINFYQTVYSDSGSPYIKVRWIMENGSSSDYTGGKLLFHFDADVPDNAWDDDYVVAIDGHNALCQQASMADSQCAGFVWLYGGFDYILEDTRDWFDRATDDEALLNLLEGNFWEGSEFDTGTTCPVYVDSIMGDMGIGIIVSLPDLSPGQQETLLFAFAVAPDPDSFKNIAQYLDSTDTSGIFVKAKNLPRSTSILTAPNPVNSYCRIICPNDVGKISIMDISGRCVAVLPAENGVAIWHPDANIPDGIYFATSRNSTGKTAKGKILYVK
ncbi:hypothetical protein DRQ26_04035 [bacterium]|nr:MAG: hypothetical protein DRQ26_04035 [bacterium]